MGVWNGGVLLIARGYWKCFYDIRQSRTRPAERFLWFNCFFCKNDCELSVFDLKFVCLFKANRLSTVSVQGLSRPSATLSSKARFRIFWPLLGPGLFAAFLCINSCPRLDFFGFLRLIANASPPVAIR